jgi:hypothetical protein
VGFVVDEAALGYFLSEYFGCLVAVTFPQVLTIDSSIMRGMDNGPVIEAQFLRETVAPVHERMKGTRWNGLTPCGLSTEDTRTF